MFRAAAVLVGLIVGTGCSQLPNYQVELVNASESTVEHAVLEWENHLVPIGDLAPGARLTSFVVGSFDGPLRIHHGPAGSRHTAVMDWYETDRSVTVEFTPDGVAFPDAPPR